MRISLGMLLLALAVAGVIADAQLQLTAPLALTVPAAVIVERGQRFAEVTGEWRARGLLGARQALYLRLYARFTGKASQVKAGEYALAPPLTPVAALQLLVSGKAVLHELRVIEGWRADQLLAAVRDEPALRRSLPSFDGATAMRAIGHPEVPAEGRFFPDTYRFPLGTTDVAFLQRAYAAMQRVLDEEWQARDAGVPYRSAADALAMASIVERETGAAPERPAIAGVFVRRLQKGMRLQTDPTVIYGLGAAFDGNLRRVDLLRDTPYNTYTRAGLPPTPICLPGRAAVHAALHPDAGDALYFVARGDGTHQFSATMAEHSAAVRRYQLKRP
ncbi:MAG TPA: endolytic transglycosylase MltG [Candidatus Binatia bacterium]|nr:endolytic transglycosylase MltG [Candidatus Binatia bacterium]